MNDYELNELNELAGAGKKSLAISIRKIRNNNNNAQPKFMKFVRSTSGRLLPSGRKKFVVKKNICVIRG